MAKVMSVNCGSSSVKFKLYEMPEEKVLCSGIVERIGHDDGIFTIKFDGNKETKVLPVPDHGYAVDIVVKGMLEKKIISHLDEIKAVGHRVVQGGSYFSHSVLWNEDTVQKVASLIPLAPLHNKAHLTGYEAFKKVLPNVPQVAVFDTAFHQSMEEEDKFIPEAKDKRMIICHLGSGASITATKHGKCVATSMGLTPLGGIMMNSRTGDMDPSVYYQIVAMSGKDNETVFQELNKKSGLLGVSGISNDSRDVEDAARKGDKHAILAMKLWARRVADFIGQYYVRLGGCDLIIFSAGIGENAPDYREIVLDNITEALGVRYSKDLDAQMVGGKEGLISTPDSKIKVAVIPTDEEVMIARDAYNICLKK